MLPLCKMSLKICLSPVLPVRGEGFFLSAYTILFMILFVYILKIATSLKTRRHCQMLKCTCECNIVSG